MSNNPDASSIWKKILSFIIELLKLIIAAFLGASGSGFVQ